MRKAFVFFLGCVMVFALQIDIETLQKELEKRPDDPRLLLLIGKHYYQKGALEKAKPYIEKAVKLDSKSLLAQDLLKKIEAKEKIRFFLEKYHLRSLDELIAKLYDRNDYASLVKIASFFDPKSLQQKSLLKIARVLMWEGEYDRSLAFLKHLKSKGLDFYEIAGLDYFYLGQYDKAKSLLKTLYEATGEREYGKKLFASFLALGEYDQAKKLLLELKRRGEDVGKLEERYQNAVSKVYHQLLENYEQDPNWKNTQALFWYYYNNHQKQKALALLEEYLKKYPKGSDAQIFFANVLTWEGDYKRAQKILLGLKENLEAKLLLGKILAWNGVYDKAKVLFLEVYAKGSKKQKYEAKKMLATIKMWENNDLEAKRLFKELLQENPNDEEVQEALEILNKNYRPLIEKYERLLKQDPKNASYILKLADFYQAVGNVDRAIALNERYLKLHPENLERYKVLGELYLKKKDFYKAFGNLEFWAQRENKDEAFLQLARYYYWSGFNKEALKVLDELLKKDPKFKDAIKLKAKILKIEPRFVLSKGAATIDEYFESRAKKIQALGDRVYFANLYADAAHYYDKYLTLNPEDYKVRERYAYALEYSKDYAKAAGEFYHLLWMDPKIEYKYHFAFNLLKMGEKKRAKKIYKELLDEIPKVPPSFLKDFLKKWKSTWESMDIDRYAKFYDSKSFDIYWRLRKEALFKNSSFISVAIYDPMIVYHKGDIYKIRFFQVYASKRKKDEGYKTLTVRCKDRKCLILKEEWRAGKYEPYDPKKSLEFFIKRDLAALEGVGRTAPSSLKLQIDEMIEEYKKKSVPNANKVEHKKKDILLAPGQKKNKTNESNVFNYIQLVKVKPKSYVVQEYRSKVMNDQPEDEGALNFVDMQGYFFHDNQKSSLRSVHVKYARQIRRIWLAILYQNVWVKQNRRRRSFGIYGLDGENNRIRASLYYDKGSEKVGWEVGGRLLLHNIMFSRKNLALTRQTYRASYRMSNKVELSRYISTNEKRGFWYSLAFEKIDKNYVFTPQFDYEFFDTAYKDMDVVFALSGWYQFNKKRARDYYSPKKIDNTFIGVRMRYSFGGNSLRLRANSGYSFWDRVRLYGYGFTLEKVQPSSVYYIDCTVGNSTQKRRRAGYRSMACTLNLRKYW